MGDAEVVALLAALVTVPGLLGSAVVPADVGAGPFVPTAPVEGAGVGVLVVQAATPAATAVVNVAASTPL